MAQYSIKEVETLSGVKAHTLRIWEQRYDFLKPHRTDTNIRYYSDDQLRMLLNISMLNREGFRISKIAEMTREQLGQEVMKIADTTNHADHLLDQLTQAMLDFNEHRFERTLSQAIMKIGFEAAFNNLVFPFMIRTGVLWAAGSIRPAQEHFITNLIRRKLSVAIDNQFVEPNENSKRYVLFLPEGETHELLLLFTEFLLRQKNHHVAYLGSSLPFEDISYINEHFKPDYLITFITVPLHSGNVKEYVSNLSASFPAIDILIGGSQIEPLIGLLPYNVKPLTGIESLVKYTQ